MEKIVFAFRCKKCDETAIFGREKCILQKYQSWEKCKMKNIWIYRPDIEAAARKINRNFVYNGRGKAFWGVLEQRKAENREINEILQRLAKQPPTKIEVPDD